MLLREVGVEVSGNLLPGGVSRHKLRVGVEIPLLVGVSKPTSADSGNKVYFNPTFELLKHLGKLS